MNCRYRRRPKSCWRSNYRHFVGIIIFSAGISGFIGVLYTAADNQHSHLKNNVYYFHTPSSCVYFTQGWRIVLLWPSHICNKLSTVINNKHHVFKFGHSKITLFKCIFQLQHLGLLAGDVSLNPGPSGSNGIIKWQQSMWDLSNQKQSPSLNM